MSSDRPVAERVESQQVTASTSAALDPDAAVDADPTTASKLPTVSELDGQSQTGTEVVPSDDSAAESSSQPSEQVDPPMTDAPPANSGDAASSDGLTLDDDPTTTSSDDAVSDAGQPATGNATNVSGDAPSATEEQSDRALRRVSLSPSVDLDQFKPVPNLAPGLSPASKPVPVVESRSVVADASTIPENQPERVSEPSGEVTGETETATAAGLLSPSEQATIDAAILSMPNSSAPVALPPKNEELDEALEAEIQAAMADEEQSAVADVAVEQIAEGEESAEALAEDSLEQGTRLTGRVQSIHGDDVFVDLGYRSPGVFKLRQYESPKAPVVGQQFEVIVDRVDPAEGLILVNPPSGAQNVRSNWDVIAAGQIVDCLVTKTNKGGLEVNVGSLRGFLPAGQVDFRYVDDLDPLVGQKLRVKIIEANRQKRNLVVSRRGYLEIQRKEAEEALWSTIEADQTFTGTVKTIKDYGAFVDLGGVDAFLHIGEISWSLIDHPSEVLQIDQEVEVKVLSLDPEKKRISLGMKQLAQNPWATVEEKFPSGQTVSGKVTRTADFGAFIELEPGVEGLVHISELDYKRVNKVTDVLSVDQEVDVQVIDVNAERRRIGLSLKALQTKPQDEPAAPSELDESETAGDSPSAESKPKGPLKGGIGEATKGGLFGNPDDYS